MVLFKINGERNSGTNFLFKIMSKNGFPVYEHTIIGRKINHWKHGVPNNSYKQLNERVIDIFIFNKIKSRNLT